jgi:hypothetical protein
MAPGQRPQRWNLPRHTASNRRVACAQNGRPRCPNGPFLHDGFSDQGRAGRAWAPRATFALCAAEGVYFRDSGRAHIAGCALCLGCCDIDWYAAWLLSYWTRGCCLQVSNNVDGRPGLQ